MADVSDPIAEKKTSAEILLGKGVTIYDEFCFIYETSRLDITLVIKDKIEDIRKSLEFMTSSKKLSPWELGNHIGIIDANFESIAAFAQNFDPGNIKTGASYTYILTTKSDMDSFLQYHRVFKANKLSGLIYSTLVENIKLLDPEDAYKEYLKYDHSAGLFACYLDNRFKELPKEKHMPYIIVLERTKTRALLGHDAKEEHIKPGWPLQRFGLVPAVQHKTLAEIGSLLWGSRAKISTIDSFVSLAGMKKVNVLVIMSITSSPIEYDVSGLLESTPEINTASGINGAILKKFNTVHKHIKYDPSGTVIMPKKLGFSATQHKTTPGSRNYIVIRSIDGFTWDIMKNSANDANNYVDAFLVEKLLRGSSLRVNEYQKIKAAAFGKFIMMPPDMGDTVKKENKTLIQDLVNRITGRIIQYVDKSLLPLPESPKGLEDAISDPRFVEIMIEEFLNSYIECGIDPKTPTDEVIGTFIADLDTSIAIQFARNIKLNMIELGPGANIFRDYHGDTLRTRLYNLFVEVIKKSVTSSIMTKENIYEKILIKDHLLGLLAHQLSKAEDKHV